MKLDLFEVRHFLHSIPEVSCKEYKTQEFIIEQLSKIGVSQIWSDFFETAVLAEIDSEKPGKTLLFRCELDALPIHESNDFKYKSIFPGQSHKCGHDGHMTILLGLAEMIVQNKLNAGKVLLLFQPGEEDGVGAAGVLNSNKLRDYNVDYVFALHNVPGFKLGQIVCKEGIFTPSVISLDVELTGKTTHAGMPWAGINPIYAIMELATFYNGLNESVDDTDFFISSPIQINLGEQAYGVCPGKGIVSYTFRGSSYNAFEEKLKIIADKSAEIVKQTKGLQGSLEWKQRFDNVSNDESAFKLLKVASDNLGFNFLKKERMFNWGEDFGLYTIQYKGLMFGLGSGFDHAELHSPDYDFPDELLKVGIDIFYEIICQNGMVEES